MPSNQEQYDIVERVFGGGEYDDLAGLSEGYGDGELGPQWDKFKGSYTDFYDYKVRMLIEDARAYNLDIRAPKREMAMRYYMGIEPYLDEQGRSTMVSTDVRDTVLAIMPSLMRIFTSQEHVCEYIPTTEAMVPVAQEATEYVKWIFMEDNPGFLTLHHVFKDALTKGEGAIRWYTDDNPTVIYRSYQNITMEQVQLLCQDEGIEVIEMKTRPIGIVNQKKEDKETAQGINSVQPTPQDPDDDTPTYDLTVKIDVKKPITRVEAVPPDEFRIDRYAKGVYDSSLVGIETIKTPSELIAMGYDQDLVDQYRGISIAAVRWNEERALRNQGLELGVGGPDVQGGVMYGEYFIKVDKDGDGIAELRRICVMGDRDNIVADTPVDIADFAYFCGDPEPHTAIGHSISELVMDIQKIKTNIVRNSLDSIAQTIYPRLTVVEGQVNLDDVLNAELGAPIRMRAPGMVNQLPNTFVGEAPMSMIQYLDSVRQSRTGISEASKGLDPKALQSTTVKGVEMVITGAQERIELIARILAETGMKDTFKGLLREITNNPNPQRIIKVRGNWVPINPSAYDPNMGVMVNPALGRGSDSDRFVMLAQIAQKQEMIIQTFGPNNPMVSPIEVRNTYEDMLSIAGIKNVSRYFKQVTPEQIQAAAQQPPPPNPQVMAVQVEQQKVQAQAVKDSATQDMQYTKMQKEDEFRREKLRVDTVAKLAQAHIQSASKSGGASTNADMQQADHYVQLMMQQQEHQHELNKQQADQTHEVALAQAQNEAQQQQAAQEQQQSPGEGGGE